MLQCKAVDSALDPIIDCNKMKKETKMVARLTPMEKYSVSAMDPK